MKTKQEKRKEAKIRLEKQLESNSKTAKKSRKKIQLTENDIKRINKEIETLSK